MIPTRFAPCRIGFRSRCRSHHLKLNIVAWLAGSALWVASHPLVAQETLDLVRKAQQLESAGNYQAAFDSLSKRIKEAPDEHVLYYWRGRQAFCLSRIDDAVADFDHYYEHVPSVRSRQWERGIALYYAGRYEDGAQQFNSYQGFDSTDVENAIWHFLCTAKKDGVDAARKRILPVNRDTRVPMMEILRLFRGESTPEKVLEQANAASHENGKPSRPLFYAHLYIGLHYDVQGEKELAAKHLKKAQAEKIPHYMWNVADVHVKLLQ